MRRPRNHTTQSRDGGFHDPDSVCNFLALRQANRRISQLFDHALAPFDLRATQFTILMRLASHDRVTINEMARVLVMDRSTLGHNLRPLAARGLVEVGVDPSDRRKSSVRLTRSGVALTRRVRQTWDVTQSRFEAAYGPDRAAILRSLLLATLSVPAPLDGAE